MLELAILGLLQEHPMHGYELRKELATKLGTIRAAISYGTLYPTLKRLQKAGWIGEAEIADGDVIPPLTMWSVMLNDGSSLLYTPKNEYPKDDSHVSVCHQM